jgi:hypothetical protein
MTGARLKGWTDGRAKRQVFRLGRLGRYVTIYMWHKTHFTKVHFIKEYMRKRLAKFQVTFVENITLCI